VNLYDQVWQDPNYCPNALDRACEVIDDLVQTVKENRWTVLDVGCGRGQVVKLLRDHRIKAVGIDPFLPADTSHCLRGDLAHLLTLGCRADVVVSFDVLEHLSEDGALGLLRLMGEVSNRCLVAIANMDDVHQVGDRQIDLHQIKEPAPWWCKLMRRAGWDNLRLKTLPYPERFFIWGGE
jgi:2-polyprenyl-3-methyl-5-hydroxy-6-metoxy-1,4-benzoquinol methylase